MSKHSIVIFQDWNNMKHESLTPRPRIEQQRGGATEEGESFLSLTNCARRPACMGGDTCVHV